MSNQTNSESDFTQASYRIRVNGTLYSFADPEPTSHQIMATIGLDPTLHVLILVRPDGENRVLALDEEVNLRQPGIEEFLFATNRRIFSTFVDDVQVDFDKHNPNGAEILARVVKSARDYALVQAIEGLGIEDRFVDAEDATDLRRPGMERFNTAPWEGRHPITIFVNTQPKVVTRRRLSYDEIVRLACENPQGGLVMTPGAFFSITYSEGCHPQIEGSVVAGQSVKVKEGMIIHVRATNQS